MCQAVEQSSPVFALGIRLSRVEEISQAILHKETCAFIDGDPNANALYVRDRELVTVISSDAVNGLEGFGFVPDPPAIQFPQAGAAANLSNKGTFKQNRDQSFSGSTL